MRENRTPLPIENCGRWLKFLCPKTWNQLDRTDDFDVRFCTSCRKNVYFCDTMESVTDHRQAGDCICIDTGVAGEELLGESSPDDCYLS